MPKSGWFVLTLLAALVVAMIFTSCSGEDFKEVDSMELTLTNDNLSRSTVPKVRMDAFDPTSNCNINIVIMGDGFESSEQQDFVDRATHIYNMIHTTGSSQDNVFHRWKDRIDWYYSISASNDGEIATLAEQSGYDSDGVNTSGVSKSTWLSTYRNRSNNLEDIGMSEGARTTLDTKLKNTFTTASGPVFALIISKTGDGHSVGDNYFTCDRPHDNTNQHNKTQIHFGSTGDYDSVVGHISYITQDVTSFPFDSNQENQAYKALLTMIAGFGSEYYNQAAGATTPLPSYYVWEQHESHVFDVNTFNQFPPNVLPDAATWLNIPSSWQQRGMEMQVGSGSEWNREWPSGTKNYMTWTEQGATGWTLQMTPWLDYLAQKEIAKWTQSVLNQGQTHYVNSCDQLSVQAYPNPYPNI